jgi:hypothetical protein
MSSIRPFLGADIRRMNGHAVHAAPRKTGVIILGGGLPKHHICNANLMRNGSDFAVYVNTAQEFDGSDSGASPGEAVSWGKIRANAQAVKVRSTSQEASAKCSMSKTLTRLVSGSIVSSLDRPSPSGKKVWPLLAAVLSVCCKSGGRFVEMHCTSSENVQDAAFNQWHPFRQEAACDGAPGQSIPERLGIYLVIIGHLSWPGEIRSAAPYVPLILPLLCRCTAMPQLSSHLSLPRLSPRRLRGNKRSRLGKRLVHDLRIENLLYFSLLKACKHRPCILVSCT